jgi:DNA-binding HxlR family transcriptional regulator
VEYRLTELGESLMPRVQMLVDWALEHMGEIMKHREVMAK